MNKIYLMKIKAKKSFFDLLEDFQSGLLFNPRNKLSRIEMQP